MLYLSLLNFMSLSGKEKKWIVKSMPSIFSQPKVLVPLYLKLKSSQYLITLSGQRLPRKKSSNIKLMFLDITCSEIFV